ncbi:hypothetical protein PPTG_00343 [Phytophthora nicotianae INRA-310]|uniref:Core-binding (CB) domain-containing protein n=1 Tax=Phytophthora nicotianae (strain INRA-310) TaxID=761204 RepID=W2RGT1_PHYN3|nr:hypothetical protein PPTG_00343 [Phytophthora nicotianae INRA-310]ETN23834.1 hypothetical protein PPTG_00343 [Phytophthora nicotianae INRA-310]
MNICGATKCLTVNEEDMSSSDHDAATVDASMEDAARQTGIRRNLSGDQVRSACTSANTKKANQSYLKGISTWIHASQPSPDTFFCEDGSLNLAMFSPQHFEDFLLYKINEGKLKVSTLSGYRSSIKDVYRQKRLDLPSEYLDDLKILYQGLKRVEAEDDQSGRSRRPGKEPLSYSLYTQLAKLTLALEDNGFLHLFLLTQWNLMCRSVSVETLHLTHLHCADDSVGCVLHKTKTNQEGSGPKDPRHIYANPLQPSCCWMLALGLYLASNPTLVHGKLFPGSIQKSRFSKTISSLLQDMTGKKVYGTHSIRKGVATFASSGSTDRYFRYESAGDQYLGRVVAGLPQNSSHFGELPPHFDDPLDDFVRKCTRNMFRVMAGDAHIAPVFQLCLASIAAHATFLRENLKSKHAVFMSYVFRNSDVLDQLTTLLNTGESTWMRPTGSLRTLNSIDSMLKLARR